MVAQRRDDAGGVDRAVGRAGRRDLGAAPDRGGPPEPGDDGPGRRPLVATHGLTKRYDGRAVVDDVSLTIRRGEVYGLLGPNGAGKTTTLRMLLGLVRPTGGTASVVDAPPGSPGSLARTGALVEEPALYPYLTGRANLRVLARYAGAPRGRVEATLERVGLLGRADDRVGTYSLGMRQRLGVAAALLKDPPLLVLDEPTNGLDPQSIAQMRRLVSEYGTGDRSVLLSSHQLAEVEQVCDRVGVIRDGRLVAQGPVVELRGAATVRVGATPVDRAAEVIRAVDGVASVDVAGDRLVVTAPDVAPADLNARLVGAGVAVHHLSVERATLEDAFLALTGDRSAP